MPLGCSHRACRHRDEGTFKSSVSDRTHNVIKAVSLWPQAVAHTLTRTRVARRSHGDSKATSGHQPPPPSLPYIYSLLPPLLLHTSLPSPRSSSHNKPAMARERRNQGRLGSLGEDKGDGRNLRRFCDEHRRRGVAGKHV